MADAHRFPTHDSASQPPANGTILQKIFLDAFKDK
jgi:hypothetical protein